MRERPTITRKVILEENFYKPVWRDSEWQFKRQFIWRDARTFEIIAYKYISDPMTKAPSSGIVSCRNYVAFASQCGLRFHVVDFYQSWSPNDPERDDYNTRVQQGRRRPDLQPSVMEDR